MPELRKDPVIGRWVIIATERARRPGNFIDPEKNIFDDLENQNCPFCDNHDEIVYDSGEVRVVTSGHPVLKTDGGAIRREDHGLYYVMSDYGTHEVVIETPEHIANMADLDEAQIAAVIHAYTDRFRALCQDPNIHYIVAYKNYGWAAGSRRIGHSRSQLIGSAVNPIRVKDKLAGAKKYFDLHDRCLYCDLIAQESEFFKRVIFENDHFLAVSPFAPRFPFEIWIIPKKHHCDFAMGVAGLENDLAQALKQILRKLKTGLDDPAYNYIIQTAPLSREKKWDQWRTIEKDYHWHIEVIPRLSRVAGFEKGTGFYICPIPPEDAAAFLREVET